MKRALAGLGIALLLPVVAGAQTPPPPPTPPAPPAPPVVATPAPPPGVWELVLPRMAETTEAMHRAQEAMRHADFFQTTVGPIRVGGSDYASGLSYLQRRDYEQAISRFDRAIARANS
ncbi:MAG TPA: hypothetical protein VMM93_01370, partial [Vicinamibacterales bacterium]|nr:hypothetical protein [Vicinamibacterales bacterium]